MTRRDHQETDGASPTLIEPIGPRRATIASEVDSPETVAAAIAPDDTDEIDTRVEGDRVVTTIERETTGGLEATIDDYVVALDVATTTASHAADVEDAQADSTEEQLSDRHDTDTL